MSDSQRWSDQDSRDFVAMSDIIVPSRSEQMDMVASLIPAQQDEWFMAVDIACGEGFLSKAILERFPNCQMTLLDGSEAMLTEAATTLGDYALQIDLRQFDLMSREWLDELSRRNRAIVSSLAIHHLDADGKRQLYQALFDHLVPGGALIIADLVEPSTEVAWDAYARHWDDAAREQSSRLTGSLDIFHQFQDGWNHFRTPDHEFDTPSGLFEQLRWLDEIGFVHVDCFWLRAGHAVFGGYRPAAE